MHALRNRSAQKNQFHPTFDRLESRTTPAQVYGWHLGTMMFFDDGQQVSDVPHVQAPVLPSVIHAVVAPVVENADGTISVTVQVTANQGNGTAASLGAGLLVNVPGAAVVLSGVEQSHLVGIQADAGSVRVAYAAYQPGDSFTQASFTMTFAPSTAPTIAFTDAPPCWLTQLDTSSLDAYFARGD